MNSRRSLFIMMFVFVSFILYQEWQADYYGPKPDPNATVAVAAQAQTNAEIPTAPQINNEIIDSNIQSKGRLITVESDVLRLSIDTVGGDIVRAELLEYAEELNSKQAYAILGTEGNLIYAAQSGLVGPNGIDTTKGRPMYSVNQDKFILSPDQKQITVPFEYKQDGVTYTKNFILKRGAYNIGVDYTINNQSSATIQVQSYGQLKESTYEASSGFFGMKSYHGAAYSSEDKSYKKYSFGDMADQALDVDTKAGWIAMMQHYFLRAWVPDQNSENTLYARTNKAKDIAFIGYRGPLVTVQPNTTANINSQLWLGPKLQEDLAVVANNLDLTIDYGWAWFISKPLSMLLQWIYTFVGNWGLAIIAVTFIVKAIMYPLTKAQYTSMAKMRMLQPKLKAIQERLGDDKQKISQETMKLYKDEKVNPLGGCLPILLQMPIFLGLYYMFMEAVEFRHAPFMLWIHDLSAADPLFILPILMGASMFLLQKMSPTPIADPMQQKMMMFLPLVFMVFFVFFPAGLVLYWLVSNVITILQQQWIYRELEKKGLHSRGSKKKKGA